MCYKQTAVCQMLVSFCFRVLYNIFTVVTETYRMFNKYKLNSHYNLHRIYYSLIVYTNVVAIDRQTGRQADMQAGNEREKFIS